MKELKEKGGGKMKDYNNSYNVYDVNTSELLFQGGRRECADFCNVHVKTFDKYKNEMKPIGRFYITTTEEMIAYEARRRQREKIASCGGFLKGV